MQAAEHTVGEPADPRLIGSIGGSIPKRFSNPDIVIGFATGS